MYTSRGRFEVLLSFQWTDQILNKKLTDFKRALVSARLLPKVFPHRGYQKVSCRDRHVAIKIKF